MMNAWRRFVDCSRKKSAPLVVGEKCPISLHYRT
jgi:hypothetical protein